MASHTTHNSPTSDSSPSSPLPTATPRTPEEIQVLLRAQFDRFFSNPSERNKLLEELKKGLLRGSKVGLDMHLTAFRRDPVASKAARNATFNRFVHFLAPLARTGSVSNRGHQDAAWSSSSGTWFDWELGQELWESIGGVGKACNAFPVYNGRLKYLNGKYDIEWRSHYRKHRSDAGWVAREHDWVTSNLTWDSIISVINSTYYPDGAPDPNRGFVFDNETLADHPDFAPLIAKWAVPLHAVFDVSINPSQLLVQAPLDSARLHDEIWATPAKRLPNFKNKSSGSTEYRFLFNDLGPKNRNTSPLGEVIKQRTLRTWSPVPLDAKFVMDKEQQLTTLASARGRHSRSTELSSLVETGRYYRHLFLMTGAEVRREREAEGWVGQFGEMDLDSGSFGVANEDLTSTKGAWGQVFANFQETVYAKFDPAVRKFIDAVAFNRNGLGLAEKKEDAWKSAEFQVSATVFNSASDLTSDLDIDSDSDSDGPVKAPTTRTLRSVHENKQHVVADAGPFVVVTSRRREKGATENEINKVITDFKAKYAGVSEQDSDYEEDEDVPESQSWDPAHLDGVARSFEAEVDKLTAEPRSAQLLLHALHGMHALPWHSSFSLGGGLGLFTRAKAYLYLSKDEFEQSIFEHLLNTLWIVIFAFLLPTAGLAALYARSALAVVMNRTGLSRGAQAALRAIGLDVEGFVLNFERYATHGLSSIQRSDAFVSVTPHDPRWVEYLLTKQANKCFKWMVCRRKPILELGQRKGREKDNRKFDSKSRYLATAMLNQRKPRPQKFGLPDASHYTCVSANYTFTFVVGIAVSLIPITVIMHLDHKTGREKDDVEVGPFHFTEEGDN